MVVVVERTCTNTNVGNGTLKKATRNVTHKWLISRPACTNLELILNGFKAARKPGGLIAQAYSRFSIA